MKKIFAILTVIIFGIFIFSACEKIEPPYKENNDNPNPPDTGNQSVKTVLLEDYTGHKCPNCPAAAQEAERIQETYGKNKVIVVAVHAGYFAVPRPGTIFDLDLNTDTGTEWDSYFGISAIGNPKGMVNRVEFDDGRVLDWGKWDTKVSEELNKTPQINISVNNSFDNNTKKLTTTVTGKFLENMEGDYYLEVCITEDSIVGAQLDGINVIEDYVFMHVLRGDINSPWGEIINANSTAEQNQEFEKTYTITLNDEWVPEHCNVVAFVYLDSDKSIIQTDEKAVIE